MEVQPLTRCNSDGEPYQRTPVVTQQIERALPMTPEELINSVKITDSTSPNYIQEECLVHLIRHYHRQGNSYVVNALSEALINRSKKNFYRRLYLALGPDCVDDAYGDVICKVFERILDLESDRADFFEARYWHALKMQVISVYKDHAKRKAKDQDLLALTTDKEEEDESTYSDNSWEAIADRQLSPEQHLLLSEAIHSLSEPYRTAYILHHTVGLQIESQDPLEPTVSKHFNRTSRAIRYWLTKAEEQLEKWRGNL